MNSKVLTLDQLREYSTHWRGAGKRIVATNGCFDILHVGHVRYLAQARDLGDLLIVGLNGDGSVQQLKGEGRPINDEQSRAEVIAALQVVNFATIFPERRATNFLRAAQPSIYVKGGDYKPHTLNAQERQVLDELGARVEILPFHEGYSTSHLLTRIGWHAR